MRISESRAPLPESGRTQPPPADGRRTLRPKHDEFATENSSAPAAQSNALTPQEMVGTPHEPQAHQIGPEMRNEEHRRVRAEPETSHSRYFDLYHCAPVGYCTVSADGRVVNPHFPALRADPLALSGASRRKQIPCSPQRSQGSSLMASSLSMARMKDATCLDGDA